MSHLNGFVGRIGGPGGQIEGRVGWIEGFLVGHARERGGE